MGAADFYTGIVPDVYAALRGTTFDAAPYLEFVLQAGQPALELGCGDDGPFLELVRRGIDIEGIDSSEDMLSRCHAHAVADGLQIVTHHQRMEDLSLPRAFRAVYLAGPTFNLLPDDSTAVQALRAIRQHLEPDGVAMIPLWVPPATPLQQIGVTQEGTTADGALCRYTVESEEHDEKDRTRRTHTRYELIRGERAERVWRDWIIHWHTPDGFASLAHQVGLDVVRVSPVVDGEFTVFLKAP